MNNEPQSAAPAIRDLRGRPTRVGIYKQLAEGLAQLQRIGGLPSPGEAEDIWGDIWYAEAHNSTAIEGNTLLLNEVEILLRDGRAIGNKELGDYLEVQGYATAARWVYNQALAPDWTTGALISMSEVRHLHHLIMSQVWEVRPHDQALPEERPGNFRRHDIAPFPGGMTPPPWPAVDAAVRDWVDLVAQGPDAARPLPETLAEWFTRFEQIHPFLDGNGRTGRLLMNLALIRLGYPPAIVFKRQRSKYLLALQKADAGVYGPFGEFLARAILDTLNKFLVPALAGPHRLVPIAALTDAAVTLRALRDAAIRGRLKAQHGRDGQWYSTRSAVDEYKESRQRRSEGA